jgi:hypothetical protein
MEINTDVLRDPEPKKGSGCEPATLMKNKTNGKREQYKTTDLEK